jgi:maltose O-acetyltransferase
MISKLLRYVGSMLPMGLGTRANLYRVSGMKIGRGVSIDRGVHVTKAQRIHLGDRVTISTGVSLLGEVTSVNSRLEAEFGVRRAADIVIEDDVYIGVKATILPGVRVGRMATVAANTLVMSDVPPYAVVLGVPGRVILIRQPKGGQAQG